MNTNNINNSGDITFPNLQPKPHPVRDCLDWLATIPPCELWDKKSESAAELFHANSITREVFDKMIEQNFQTELLEYIAWSREFKL